MEDLSDVKEAVPERSGKISIIGRGDPDSG